jgi:large subunit ribosomal protein L9
MKVILLQDIEKLGKKYDVKEVAEGYARNYLIPRKLAKIATPENLAWAEERREIEEKKAEEELKKIGELVSKIDGLEVEIGVRVGEKGQLYEKIDAQKIAKKLKEMGFAVAKSQIQLEKPFEELGEYPVKVKFEHNLEAEIKLIISEKESSAAEEDEE